MLPMLVVNSDHQRIKENASELPIRHRRGIAAHKHPSSNDTADRGPEDELFRAVVTLIGAFREHRRFPDIGGWLIR